jgi:predicted PurR-regulated permease PerM
LVVGLAVLILVLRSVVLALLVALFMAIVFMPVVDALARHRVSRTLGASVALLIVIAVGAGTVVLVVSGVASQHEKISRGLRAAVGKLDDILASAGVSGNAAEAADQSVRHSASTVLVGLAPALGNLFGPVVNVVVGLFVALFFCFFLLKDGHTLATWAAGRLPLSDHLSQRLFGEAAVAIRRYFMGLTLLGVFNAGVVAVGALILHVPLVGTIAVITFLGTYVPYFGATVSGAFAVLMALAAGGPATALWMILIVILANTVLQNLISPFAYGAALQLRAPVILLTAVLGGALAGIIGLTLATPVTAIVQRSVQVFRRPHQPVDETDPPP